ncbi:hypothetical protein K2Z84_27795, partial [Candidatus Binatia bacterium]|nr:hypothetical protein [Candidatus Binatia bacterium]
MSDQPTKLRNVCIHGPCFGNDPAVDPPMWELTVGAPHFRTQRDPDAGSSTEDNVHPIRTRLIDEDPTAISISPAPSSGSSMLRVPRAMSVHVIAGSRNAHYASADETLSVRLQPKLAVASATDGSLVTLDGEHPGFVHVVVEPVAPARPGDPAWPAQRAAGSDILLPPVRLLSGAIALRTKRATLPWLDRLIDGPPTADVRLDLTPRGIELDAAVPFPGFSALLPGRFLLCPVAARSTKPAALELRLLPEQLPAQHVALWMAAWQAVTPDESGGAALPGMQLSARRSGRPPAFRWRLSVAGTGLAALPSQVEVPREDVRLILAGTGTAPPDGIAEIRSEHVHLVSLPAKERPTATLQEFDLSPAALDFVGAQGVVPANTVALVVEGRRVAEPRWAASYEARRLGKSDVDADLHVFAGRGADAIPLSHDSRRLAARLREVYGLPEPRLPGAGSDDVAARAAGAPAVLPRDDVDPARPLLYGFVPLARGWLQIPLPNVLQQNPDDDGAMLGAVGRRSASALDGFVRIAQTVQLPSISGHDERPPDAMRSLDAAWSVAVEGAAGAAGVVVLEPGPAAKMRTAAICLDEPELSCRGLLWLSSDRPDGLEALPRVGAGPGSFLDVPLTTAAAGRVGPAQFALRRLHLDLERASATRDDLELVLTWLDNASTTASAALASPSAGSATEPATSSAPTTAPPSPRAIAWLRHPILPLAAEMPMTRSAAAAVRPLESRDLAPFVVEPVVTPKGTVVVPIAWRAAAPFARLESPVGQGKAPSMTLSSTWPSPTTPARPHTENGVAFAAFGVPGAELVPAGDGGWSSMRYAYRFDLPVLDEAFATATVPPPPDGPSPAAAVTPTAGAADDRTVPPPTALDPTSLAAFWAEQQRRHQLARVVHSYAVPFGDVGAPQSTSIETLIEGAALAATSSFRVQTSSAALPYGAIDFGTLAGPASGDEALLGVSGTFAVAGDRIERLDGLPPADGDGAPQVDPRGVAAEQVALLGWSPSTWVADGFQLDNARLGVQAPPAPVGLAVLRPLRHRGTPYQLATTLRPLPIAGTALELWFKDVPLDASGTFVLTDRLGKPAETDTAFDAWMSDRLPFDGYEWRLYATGGDGRASDRLPFFGFTLEPLHLSRLRLEPASGETTRVVLLARLLLGAEGSRLHRSENLVLLELAPAAPGGPLSIRSVTPFGGQAAVFPLEQPAHGSRPARSARLSGVPGFAGGGLTLGDAVLELDVHGIPMRFAKTVAVTVSPAGGVEATWDAPASTGRPDSGRGQLRVQRVRVAVPPPGDAASPAAPRIDIDTLLEIQPMQVFKPAQVQIAAVRWQQTQSADAARRDHDGLHVLGLKLVPPATVDASPSPEDDGALALVLEGAVRGAPCVGWPEQDGTARAMLAVTLRGPQQGMPSDQPLRAVCGRVEMVVTFEGESNGMALREMHVVLEAGRPESADPDKWNGEITLTGQIARTSAIRWPHVRVEPPDADVPEPGTADRDGRRRVRGFGTEALTHTATYVLRRHRLPFGFFLYAPDLDRWAMAFAWTVLASAHHELSVGDRRLSWWSVESLSIGSPAILFEEDHVERDPLAFAARYRDDLDGVQRKRNPDMVLPGLGRMGGVLHGLLGREFRTAAKGDVAHRGRLLAVGGFVGFLDGRKDDAAARDAFSLVRLPFVVRLGDPTDDPLAPGAVTQSGVAGTTRELAWVDTTVARDVRRAVELAATPRARDEAALQAAVYAASAWSQRKLDQELQLAAAVLVEQAFVKSVDGPPNLATTPFWLSAANVLWQAFEQNARQVASDTPDPQGGLRSAVSIVSGRLLRTASPPLPASDPPVGVSALLRAAPPTTDDAPAAMAAGAAPVLLSAGDLLLEEPWPATTVEPDATSLRNGLAAAMALRAHARPRLAMVRGPHRTADGDRIAFVKIKLPRPVLAEMPRARAPQSPPVFAEPGR